MTRCPTCGHEIDDEWIDDWTPADDTAPPVDPYPPKTWETVSVREGAHGTETLRRNGDWFQIVVDPRVSPESIHLVSPESIVTLRLSGPPKAPETP